MAWSAYRRALEKHPFRTKALTTSCITALSDVGLQVYENSSSHQHKTSVPRIEPHSWPTMLPELNWSRTLTLGAVGLVYSGPVNHIWFATLEKLVRTRTQIQSVATKLFIDQTLFVPVVISGYMAVRGVFEGKDQVQISTQLMERVPVATAAAWQFWPIVNLVSFSLVPVMYRVLFGNICALFWNAKLSLLSMQTEDVVGLYVDKLRDVEGFDDDETLPSLGFDEAWALGSAANSQAVFGTGFDEMLPTPGFDEAWAVSQSTESIHCTGFDECLPTSGFDEAWALDSGAHSKDVYATDFDENTPTYGFDEVWAIGSTSQCQAKCKQEELWASLSVA